MIKARLVANFSVLRVAVFDKTGFCSRPDQTGVS